MTLATRRAPPFCALAFRRAASSSYARAPFFVASLASPVPNKAFMNAMLVVPLPLPRSRAPLLPRAHAPLAVRLSARLCSPPWAMPPLPRVPAPRFRAHAHWLSRATHPPSLPPSRVTRAAARLSSVVGLRASRASHPALLRSFLVGHAAASAGPGATASRYRALAGPPIPPIHPPSLPRDTSCRKAELRGRPQCLARLPHPALPRSSQRGSCRRTRGSRRRASERCTVRVCSRDTSVGPCLNQG